MANPIQQQSEKQANTSLQSGQAQVYTTFNNKVGKVIFDPNKYGAAIGRKLEAVLSEGALEQPEFMSALRKFAGGALTLVAMSAIAIREKGLNPGKDIAVLLALEGIVTEATDFIPLIEKLYAAYEGTTVAEASAVGEPEKTEDENEPEPETPNSNLVPQTAAPATATFAAKPAFKSRATFVPVPASGPAKSDTDGNNNPDGN